MGAPSIVYFGPDDSLRIPVLEQSGYSVERCEDIAELSRILDAPSLDAVICGEEPNRPANQAAELVRRRGAVAVILFQHPWTATDETLFDAVIPPGTAPSRWLSLLRERVNGLRRQKPLASPAAAEQAWSNIARDLRAMRGDRPGGGRSREEMRDAPEKGRIQLGERSLL